MGKSRFTTLCGSMTFVQIRGNQAWQAITRQRLTPLCHLCTPENRHCQANNCCDQLQRGAAASRTSARFAGAY